MDRESVEWMIEWIETHFEEGFSLEKLGQYMGFSPYYCSFKFHQITGVSIKRYRLLRLLYIASERLAETDQRIIEIAFHAGYTSQSAFSRAFKDLFGVTPRAFRERPRPLQTYIKISLEEREDVVEMDISQKLKIERLQEGINQSYDNRVLHVLNGQIMYQEFATHKLMGAATYVPFNEAMCVNQGTMPIFGEQFNRLRAEGHGVSPESYQEVVLTPLEPLNNQTYQCVVLWFGEDMFCQMNLLTCLAYLEEAGFQGEIYYYNVHEGTYDVKETALSLGGYQQLFQEVIVSHKRASEISLPVLHQGVGLYLELLKPENPITIYIRHHLKLTNGQLLAKLFQRFSQYGLGDQQYINIIERLREE